MAKLLFRIQKLIFILRKMTLGNIKMGREGGIRVVISEVTARDNDNTRSGAML